MKVIVDCYIFEFNNFNTHEYEIRNEIKFIYNFLIYLTNNKNINEQTFLQNYEKEISKKKLKIINIKGKNKKLMGIFRLFILFFNIFLI